MPIVLKEGALGVHSLLALVLTALLALPPAVQAQQPVAPNPAQAPSPAPFPVESLRILVLEGQDAVHDVHDRVAAMPVVEVRDENGLPVEAADVRFDLPMVGPGGSFAGQQFTATVKTNIQGQATVSFLPNAEPGRFNVRVTATIGNRMGRAVIAQTNSLRPASAEKKSGLLKFAWWKVAVVAGVGATVGIILATRGGSGSSVTLIPGSPTFGAP